MTMLQRYGSPSTPHLFPGAALMNPYPLGTLAGEQMETEEPVPVPVRKTPIPEDASEPQGVPCVTEIVLTCSTQVLAGMVAAYQTAIEQAAGELPLLILWWGHSRKRGQGTIVLEWLGNVPASFLDSLDIDEEVLDYSFYEDERVVLDEEPVSETGKENRESPENAQ